MGARICIMMVSYTLTFYNEHEQVSKLIDFFIKNKDLEDEIVVLWDSQNGDLNSYNFIKEKYLSLIKLIKNDLNSNFSNHKNYLKNNCSGEWIFNIDADETIEIETFKKIKNFLKSDTAQTLDLIYVPRVNIVRGLTKDYLEEENIKKKWKVNKYGWINFPDFQPRIFKNKEYIKWTRPIHEIITGAKSAYSLPQTKEYSIIHIKDIELQIKQNILYNSINKDIK